MRDICIHVQVFSHLTVLHDDICMKVNSRAPSRDLASHLISAPSIIRNLLLAVLQRPVLFKIAGQPCNSYDVELSCGRP